MQLKQKELVLNHYLQFSFETNTIKKKEKQEEAVIKRPYATIRITDAHSRGKKNHFRQGFLKWINKSNV